MYRFGFRNNGPIVWFDGYDYQIEYGLRKFVYKGQEYTIDMSVDKVYCNGKIYDLVIQDMSPVYYY